MNYLDPKKQLYHKIILLVGYVLITLAIVIGALILLYQAYGFGLGKNGTVIQNGLVFISSQPNPAQIYLDNRLYSSTTNARLLLPAGLYNVRLSRQGYRDWQRTIGVDGGTVIHFDYPFLFPVDLTSTKVQSYLSAPGLATQSPDRRWLLVQQPDSMTNFDLYDLKTPAKPVDSTISLPSSILTGATSSESWQLVDWADDNQHVLLEHLYDDKSEFILVDTQNPGQSINLNTTFDVNPTSITFNNKKYNQFYFYDSSSGVLQSATLGTAAPTPVLDHVLSYQTYSNNTILYATDSDAPAGKILIKMLVGNQTYIVHTFPSGGQYLLDLTKYSGTLYVVAGDSSDNKVYIFKDPVAQLAADPSHAVTPIQVLHVNNPNYVSFSDNTQFIVAEDGAQFGVYDIQNENGYNYTVKQPLDQPQQHATWMDGDRLVYVSNGKLMVADYDNTNRQMLVSQGAAYLPFFSTNYEYLFELAPQLNGQYDLDQTPLLTKADL